MCIRDRNTDGDCKMYKLIIIDDEEKIASGMAQLFPWQNIGFEVVQVFTSARKALQYIAENPVDVAVSYTHLQTILCKLQPLTRHSVRHLPYNIGVLPCVNLQLIYLKQL